MRKQRLGPPKNLKKKKNKQRKKQRKLNIFKSFNRILAESQS